MQPTPRRRQVWHESGVYLPRIVCRTLRAEEHLGGNPPTAYRPVDTFACERFHHTRRVTHEQSASFAHGRTGPSYRQQVAVVPQHALAARRAGGCVSFIVLLEPGTV